MGLRSLIVGFAAVVALSSAPALAQENNSESEGNPDSSISLGYNALETAVTNDKDVKPKLFSDIAFSIGQFQIGYWCAHSRKK